MANYGADKKPAKKKKKVARAKRAARPGKKQVRSDSGPAINRIVAEGGWGWGGASADAEVANQSTPTLGGGKVPRPPIKQQDKPKRP